MPSNRSTPDVIDGSIPLYFTTEMVNLLVTRAFNKNEVEIIHAHTMAAQNASTQVLKRCKFEFMEETHDDEDGLVWKWELSND